MKNIKKSLIVMAVLFTTSAFAQARPFIPKQSQDLPDDYGITLYYVTGSKEEFRLAQHYFNKETNVLEFWTKDDIHSWVPMTSVLRVEFDKNFSKMISIKEKIDKGAKGK